MSNAHRVNIAAQDAAAESRRPMVIMFPAANDQSVGQRAKGVQLAAVQLCKRYYKGNV